MYDTRSRAALPAIALSALLAAAVARALLGGSEAPWALAFPPDALAGMVGVGLADLGGAGGAGGAGGVGGVGGVGVGAGIEGKGAEAVPRPAQHLTLVAAIDRVRVRVEVRVRAGVRVRVRARVRVRVIVRVGARVRVRVRARVRAGGKLKVRSTL